MQFYSVPLAPIRRSCNKSCNKSSNVEHGVRLLAPEDWRCLFQPSYARASRVVLMLMQLPVCAYRRRKLLLLERRLRQKTRIVSTCRHQSGIAASLVRCRKLTLVQCGTLCRQCGSFVSRTLGTFAATIRSVPLCVHLFLRCPFGRLARPSLGGLSFWALTRLMICANVPPNTSAQTA